MDFLTLLAQAVDEAVVAREFQSWAQLATGAGFAGLTWYLLAVALPRIQTRFDEHSDRQQAVFVAELEKIRTSHEMTIQRIIGQHEAQQERLIAIFTSDLKWNKAP